MAAHQKQELVRHYKYSVTKSAYRHRVQTACEYTDVQTVFRQHVSMQMYRQCSGLSVSTVQAVFRPLSVQMYRQYSVSVHSGSQLFLSPVLLQPSCHISNPHIYSPPPIPMCWVGISLINQMTAIMSFQIKCLVGRAARCNWQAEPAPVAPVAPAWAGLLFSPH